MRGDTTAEANETVKVNLGSATNARFSPSAGTGTGTITNDDGNPRRILSINSPSVIEGDSGTADLTFTVSLSVASGTPVTVAYSDAGTGTATSGTDYTALVGTRLNWAPGTSWYGAGLLTFPPGTTSQTITVPVRGDTTDELNETVEVILQVATGARISSSAIGTGTIMDDDVGRPELSIDSPSVTEGDSGTADLTFTVSPERGER